MKARIIEEKKEVEFKPFKIELTIETIQEARLLFHVGNNLNLLGCLRAAKDYPIDRYNDDIAANCKEFYIIMKDEIQSQGFKL